jgi:5-formyltetrahydrofolate cyclo-ligase
MPDPIAEQKNLIRKQYRQIRREIQEPARIKASQSICECIAAWPLFQNVQVVQTYMPIKGEVDLRPLLNEYPQKTWVLPRILPEDDHGLRFHVYDPLKLVRHPFGMDEPAESLPVFPPQQIDMALVPGLAYDWHGWRLGYGGGYYDRFLRSFAGVSLGVVYESLWLESLPQGEYDVPVNWVVTETGIHGQFSMEGGSLRI